MSYRETDAAPAVVEVHDVPTSATLHIMNGLATEIAIPCSYVIPAVAPATDDTYEPIHLDAEGYEAPVVALAADYPVGLTATAWIDEVDDSIVRLVISALCEDATTSAVECEFSVLTTRDTGDHGLRTDCVIRGTIIIDPAPLPPT